MKVRDEQISENFHVPNFPVITVCGSMRYYARMLQVAAEFTEAGYIVLMPFTSVDEGTIVKSMLDQMHFRKILMSQAIVVVGSHIGESTQNEIEFALANAIDVERR